MMFNKHVNNLKENDVFDTLYSAARILSIGNHLTCAKFLGTINTHAHTTYTILSVTHVRPEVTRTRV